MSFFEKNVMVFLSNAPKKEKKEGREVKEGRQGLGGVR